MVKVRNKKPPSQRENQTFQRISTFISIENAINTASLKDHFILSKGASFVSQNVLDLSQVLTYCRAAESNK